MTHPATPAIGEEPRIPCARFLSFVNVTRSVDDDFRERARELARRRGVSLHELVRDHLRLLSGERTGAEAVHELLDQMAGWGGAERQGLAAPPGEE